MVPGKYNTTIPATTAISAAMPTLITVTMKARLSTPLPLRFLIFLTGLGCGFAAGFAAMDRGAAAAGAGLGAARFSGCFVLTAPVNIVSASPMDFALGLDQETTS